MSVSLSDKPVTSTVVTRERVIELAHTMPPEKLLRWYEYGLFVQASPLTIPATETVDGDMAELWQEIAAWENASDEDWLEFENHLDEVA